MEKILIDSDICLDSITGRYPFSIHANQLFTAVENKEVTAYVSAESFSNIFYILRKFSSSGMAVEQLKNLRKIVHVGILKESTIDSALTSGWNDFEDSLQYHCALENMCDSIISRNKSDFEKNEIPVLTAREYLNQKKS